MIIRSSGLAIVTHGRLSHKIKSRLSHTCEPLSNLIFACLGLITIFQVNCIVFDKTGTLTLGKPLVVNTKLLKNMVLGEFYELIAATEVWLLL